MPVGVPKVPFQYSSDFEPEWSDIFNRLSYERVLFLCSDLKEELANQLIGLMLYFNADETNTDDFLMYINSPGGSMTCGLGVYDMMNSLSSDVTTICVGAASSMASFVLAGGTKGKRIALPNARIMIHQPGGGSRGQTTIVLSEAEELVRLRQEVISIYSYRTGQSSDTIKTDLTRDQHMSAQEAKDYGLVDQVAANTFF
jgi:ATP-dependent Clp protease protease subunit